MNMPTDWTTKSTNESNSTNVSTNNTSSTACDDIGDIVCTVIRACIFFGGISLIFLLGLVLKKLSQRCKPDHMEHPLTVGSVITS